MSGDGAVLIVGAGPVGLATAIEARLAGLRATVVERRAAPVDKACGEGLMPGSLAAVRRLGVDPPGRTISGIAYVDGLRRVEHEFRGAPGRGVRRTVLQGSLETRARQLGVEFVAGRVCGLEQDARRVRLRGEGFDELSGDWLVACDGLHSTVRRLAGMERHCSRPPRDGRRRNARYGVRRHFEADPWTDLVEVHWSEETELYVTPVAEHVVGVAVLGSGTIDFAAAIARLPEVAGRLAGARAIDSALGAGPLRQRPRRRRLGRVLLAGDSSGYVDAITGEGLGMGFAQARAAVRCIARDDPAGYERAWAACGRQSRAITAALLAAAHSPLRPAIVPAARRSPQLFGAIVERLAR